MADDERRIDSENDEGYVPPAVEDLDADYGPAVTGAGASPSPLPPP